MKTPFLTLANEASNVLAHLASADPVVIRLESEPVIVPDWLDRKGYTAILSWLAEHWLPEYDPCPVLWNGQRYMARQTDSGVTLEEK